MYRSLTTIGLVIALATAVTAQVDAPPPVVSPRPGVVPDALDGGAAPVGDPADAPSIREGKALLAANCSSCHAIGPYGDSPNPEAPPFRTVMTLYPATALEESLAEGIMTGHPDMPQFILQPAEIADVVAYLDALAVLTREP